MAQNVIRSIRRYNDVCRAGRDEDFGKDAKVLRPLEGLLYIQPVEIQRNGFTMATVGGLVTDGEQNVLNGAYERIEACTPQGTAAGGGLARSIPRRSRVSASALRSPWAGKLGAPSPQKKCEGGRHARRAADGLIRLIGGIDDEKSISPFVESHPGGQICAQKPDAVIQLPAALFPGAGKISGGPHHRTLCGPRRAGAAFITLGGFEDMVDAAALPDFVDAAHFPEFDLRNAQCQNYVAELVEALHAVGSLVSGSLFSANKKFRYERKDGTVEIVDASPKTGPGKGMSAMNFQFIGDEVSAEDLVKIARSYGQRTRVYKRLGTMRLPST